MIFKPTSGLRRGLAAAAAAPQGAPKPMGQPKPDVPLPPDPPPPIPVGQDDAFLHNMTEHQKIGVKMSQVQVAKGKRADVRKVAESLILTHNKEIDRLKKLKEKK